MPRIGKRIEGLFLKRIKIALAVSRLRASDLSRMVGCSRNAISLYVCGRSRPSIETLAAFNAALGISTLDYWVEPDDSKAVAMIGRKP
jgi:transcriptional regulator with XRE-family HTH domain